MKLKTLLPKRYFTVLFLITVGILAEPSIMTYSFMWNNEQIALIDFDWNNDTDEKEDSQEKDKINTHSYWVKPKQNLLCLKTNFNFSEKKFYSLYIKVILPPPERV